MEKEEKKKTGFPNLLGGRAKSDEAEDDRSETSPIPGMSPEEKQRRRDLEAAEKQREREAAERRNQEQRTTNTMSMNEDGITDNISADLSEADKKEIYDAIDLIRRKLSFAKDFSDEEKGGLMRLGQTGRDFVDKAQGLVKRAPGILPRSFDLEEFHRDAELYQELGNLADELKKLSDRVSDTEAAVGSDAFTAALVVYQSGKLARTGDDMDNHLTGWRRKIADQVHD